MTHSQSPQTAMSGFLDSIKQDSSSSSYSLFGPKQYSESVAFWHDPSAAPTMVVPPSHTTSHKQLSDQKKHKRTRSGCFTCRSRRVKCDENRPVCERCRKGNRDCVYPSPTASSSASSVPSKPSSRSTAKSRASRPHSHGSDSSSKVDSESLSPLHPIIDEEEPDSSVSESRPSPASATTTSQPDLRKSQSAQSLRKHGARPASDTSSYIKEQSSSPSTGSPRFESVSVRSGSLGHSTTELLNNARLPDDLRFYLNFHQDFMTPPHFFLRHNSSYFIHHSLIELALQYEPLLYALVGFSAYHYSLHSPGGKLYTFLKYYNKALTLLRKSLSSGEEHSEATLCTVLVLTTFEEFIGDWMNMIDHHQAAHAFMRKLITPESANMNELHTNIFLWYARFDVVVGILSGTETVLGRDWYLAKEQHDAEQAAFYPDDPSKQLALVASINRRFGLDMASLYAKLSRGMLSMEQFAIQNDQLGQWLEQAKTILRGFDDYEYKIQHYPQKQPLTEDDVIDPYVPGVLYRGPLWDFNYAWIDILATETMYKFQTMQVLQQPLLEDLQTLAKEQCRIIETMIRWPHKENGYCINFKNSLGMLGMFLPTEHQHKYQMWARRTLALLEQHGYIIVPSFRAGLAAIWQVPEVNYWWLPNDEGYTSIVREIRSLTDERSTQPRDEKRETVRDMKSLFGKLNLDETDDDKSPP